MGDIKIFKQSDLILDVNQNFNPEVLNLDEWEWFLDVLCGNRDYQKEAIKNAIIFMASEEYTNIEDLVLDNYKRKPELQLRYPKVEDYLNSLQIRDKLHANIDLATGTGKSYVIYGIAQIMLGLGLVKRVLVLCPSTTWRGPSAFPPSSAVKPAADQNVARESPRAARRAGCPTIVHGHGSETLLPHCSPARSEEQSGCHSVV